MLPINRKISLVNWTDRNKKPKYIVVHYVGAVSTAKNNADYFYSTYRGASATYFVDETSIWQVVDDLDSAWHCGTTGTYYHPECRNTNSIGVEMCCKKKNGEWYFEPETVSNTIELIKYLMDKYNIPVSNVIRHYDVTHKNCPDPYVKDTSAWNNFKSKLTTGGSTSVTDDSGIGGTYKLVTSCKVYNNSANAKKRKNPVTTYASGTYYIYNKSNGMINVTKTKGSPGGWINPDDNKKTESSSSSTTKYSTGTLFTCTGLWTSSTGGTWVPASKLTYGKGDYVIGKVYKGAVHPYQALRNGTIIGFANDKCIDDEPSSPGSSSMTAREFALEVWNEGKHGTGGTRKNEARKYGVDYNEVQRLLNILASGGKI